jgi:uncharacterized protein YbaR (Trm112 family)
MTPELIAILVCPFCRGDLTVETAELHCGPCARRFPIVNGVPFLVDDDAPVAVVPVTHQSNPLGAEFEAILASGRELVLHIGAGATAKKYPNCIEL